MSEVDTSAEAIAAITSVHRGKIDGTVRGGFHCRTADIIDALAAERDALLDALRAADSYLDKGLFEIARNVTRAAIIKHGGSNG